MAMTTLEYDVLQAAFLLCKSLITDIQPRLAALRQQYDSAGGVKSTLTQEDLDEAPVLSGLTKTAVDDGIYVLTAVLLPGIETGYTGLSELASRARGFAPPPPVPMTLP